MKADKFPVTVTEGGVSAKIRKVSQLKNGKPYTIYIADYVLLGKRKQEGRAKFEDAKEIALNACRKIAGGEQISLSLTNMDRAIYLRAAEALSVVQVKLDIAAQEYADALKILEGKASIVEACREWIKRNAVTLPKVTVAGAVEQLKRQAITDGKSDDRQKQLAAALDRLAGAFSVEVHTITPSQMSAYLAALPFKERTKRNHRDVIGYFNRWLILRGYLAKGTDWLEGVQNYAARKIGAIQIYTPEELKLLLSYADNRLIPFLAIGAFAGLRHAEINRLDWQQVELSDKPNESFIEVLPIEGTKSDQRRRLVPIKDNLKAWLIPHRKTAGKVCPFTNTANQLLELAGDAGLKWKHNGLRHSCISYRVAESSDVPRVSDESGNSVTVTPAYDFMTKQCFVNLLW